MEVLNIYTVNGLLNNISKAKRRYWETTKRNPTHVTLHYSDVSKIQLENMHFVEPENHEVCGLKVLRSGDIKKGWCVVGEEF